MKKDDLFNAIGDVSDEHLLDEMPAVRSKRSAILKITATAAAVLLLIGTVALLPKFLQERMPPSLGTVSPGTSDATPPDTDPPSNMPTDEQVIDAYNLAVFKENEFRGPSSLGSRYGDGKDTITLDVGMYVRVTKFETWADMEDYLLDSFSRKLAEELVKTNNVNIEHEGKVYSAAADRGTNICIGQTRIADIERADGVIYIITETDILDYADRLALDPTGKIIATAEHRFKYEEIDGKWVFTEFPDIEHSDLEPYQGLALNTAEAQGNMITVGGFKLYLNPMFKEYITVKEGVYENSVVTIYYKPQYEKDGEGEILTIYRYTPGEYERRVLAGNIVGNLKALGTDGECYYVIGVHTDVTADPTDGNFWATNNSVRQWVTESFAEINMLHPVITRDFYEQLFTYEGAHKFVKYYPYGKDVNPDISYCIVLSQPATQGDGGIWCVERWYDSSLTLHPHFPESGDVAAKKYYEYVQEAYDEGKFEEYGDPEVVVITFIREIFGFDVSFGTFLEYTDSLPEGNYSY